MLEETPEEREVFSAMEQSSVRKEIIRSMDKYQSIMEELALARMLINKLSDRLAKLEKPWVDLTVSEFSDCLVKSDPCETLAEPEAWKVMRSIQTKFKEKNT